MVCDPILAPRTLTPSSVTLVHLIILVIQKVMIIREEQYKIAKEFTQQNLELNVAGSKNV